MLKGSSAALLIYIFSSSTLSLAEFSGIPPISSDYQATILTGYDSDTQNFRGVCISGDLASVGIDMANLSFRKSISQDQLAEELGFGVAGRARFGAIGVSAAVKFLSEAQSDSFSISSIYGGDYQFKNVILTNPVPSAVGKEVIRKDKHWIKTCGDEYVEQVKLGGKIFFSIRIDFASKADKRAFETNFKMSGPIWGASTAVKAAANKFSRRTEVTVSAFQMGGSVDQLSKIFGESKLFVKCSLGEFDECESVLNSALKYAMKTFPEQLSKSWDQFGRDRNAYGPGIPQGLAIMKYLTKPYTSAGIYVNRPIVVTAEIKKARQLLDQYISFSYDQIGKVEKLLSKASRRLSDRQALSLQEMRNRLRNNYERILEAEETCFDTPTYQCVKDVDRMNPETSGGLYKVNSKDLTLENESFAQFCDEGLSPQASPELQHTILALIQNVKERKPELFKPIAEGQEMDECFIASFDLLKQKKLNLSHKGISDLRPLQELTQLEELHLDDGFISDPNPIGMGNSFGGLRNLRVLSLSGNQIQDVSSLKEMYQLEILDLSGNRIKRVNDLSGLNTLKRLDLRNNSAEMVCPLVNESVCFTAEYGNLGQFALSERRSQVARFGFTATYLGGVQEDQVVMIGGTIAVPDAFAEIFSLKDGYYRLFSGPDHVRQFHSATLLENSDVLVLGGIGHSSGYILEQGSRTWTKIPSKMTSKRGAHTATPLLDGRVVIAGGFSAPTLERPTRSVEIYDPKTQSFKLLKNGLSVARAFHTATRLQDGRVLFVGGYSDHHSIISADLFDPMLETVVPVLHTRMAVGRGGHQATLLKNGDVLITGGMDEGKAVGSGEIFDPKRMQFRLLPISMVSKRAAHQATLLDNGLVLITGGQQKIEEDFTGEKCESCVASAEVYDPITSDFSSLKSPMNFPRAHHVAIPIGPGHVYIAGGLGLEAGTSAEVFCYAAK
jgi:hypothetical protein